MLSIWTSILGWLKGLFSKNKCGNVLSPNNIGNRENSDTYKSKGDQYINNYQGVEKPHVLIPLTVSLFPKKEIEAEKLTSMISRDYPMYLVFWSEDEATKVMMQVPINTTDLWERKKLASDLKSQFEEKYSTYANRIEISE